jgi:hypothetical protein
VLGHLDRQQHARDDIDVGPAELLGDVDAEQPIALVFSVSRL